MGLGTCIVALGLLQACSAIKLAYNNAPDLSYWWIDGYADLGDAQSIKVREELTRLQRWHRSTELPKVAEVLQKAQQMATADASQEQVCSLFAEARNRFDALLTQAEPSMVTLAMGLSEEQLANIQAKAVKTNAEWRDEWLAGSDSARRAKRLKSAVERSERFYGTLQEHQLAILRTAIAQSEFDPQLSYAERLRRQQDLVQTLRQISNAGNGTRASLPQAGAQVRAYLQRAVQSPNPAYRAYAEKALEDSCKTFAQLHNSASTEQRSRAARRLAEYQRDALELALQR